MSRVSAEKRQKDRQVIEEFRANGGVVDVNKIFDSVAFDRPPPLLLLHHTGRRSGKRHVTVLGRLMDGAEYILFAGSAGSDEHPDWYRNLVANPLALIDVGGHQMRVSARTAVGEERDRLHELVMADPILGPSRAKLEQMTDRSIPIVILTPV